MRILIFDQSLVSTGFKYKLLDTTDAYVLITKFFVDIFLKIKHFTKRISLITIFKSLYLKRYSHVRF